MKNRPIASIMALGMIASPAIAVERFAKYDKFNRPAQMILSSHWFGSETCCDSAETSRRLENKRLVMSHRSFGDSSSDSGLNGARTRLHFAKNVAAILQMKAKVRIRNYSLIDCPANQDSVARVRVRLMGSFFNTSDDPQDGETGDVWAGIGIRRSRDTLGGDGTFDVRGWAGRCNNADCSDFVDFASNGVVNLGQVQGTATLTLIHDPDGGRFVYRVNNAGPQEIRYDTLLWAARSPPTFQDKRIEVRTEPENCSATAAYAEIEAEIDNVKVNQAAAP